MLSNQQLTSALQLGHNQVSYITNLNANEHVRLPLVTFADARGEDPT